MKYHRNYDVLDEVCNPKTNLGRGSDVISWTVTVPEIKITDAQLKLLVVKQWEKITFYNTMLVGLSLHSSQWFCKEQETKDKNQPSRV